LNISRSTKGRRQLAYTSGCSGCTSLVHPLREFTYLAILDTVAPDIALKSAPQKFNGARRGTGVIGCSWPLSAAAPISMPAGELADAHYFFAPTFGPIYEHLIRSKELIYTHAYISLGLLNLFTRTFSHIA
jgi:hypothetical protein